MSEKAVSTMPLHAVMEELLSSDAVNCSTYLAINSLSKKKKKKYEEDSDSIKRGSEKK